MPAFTAIALDRFLEPEASNSIDTSKPSLRPPLPSNRLERRNSTSNAERKIKPPQISPALYATPEPTPLPDSPTSFSPSPYLINHKRRGPRLSRSFSEYHVFPRQKTQEEEQVNHIAEDTGGRHDDVTFTIQEPISGNDENSVNNNVTVTMQTQEAPNSLFAEQATVFSVVNGSLKLDSADSQRNSDSDGDGNVESATMQSVPPFEFYDAPEEFISESAQTLSLRDVEAELCEVRTSLLAEIELRKQAEDALNGTEKNWKRLREQLAPVGLVLPADLTSMTEMDFSNATEELCQQFYVARFVSDSIGRAAARAEMQMELEEEIESKNFEISRLCDKFHYYELVNREMSQRNQEAVELARRDRQRRARRQRWICGSVLAAVSVGAAAIAWSYAPAAGRGSSAMTTNPQSLEHNDTAK